ncbi:hypothetical protein KCP69_04770 [Salmonella enterica subsp. enterica]|nr:hypothetical protein KCP69_04770 [Salmonella enterica subsp. enterica]
MIVLHHGAKREELVILPSSRMWRCLSGLQSECLKIGPSSRSGYVHGKTRCGILNVRENFEHGDKMTKAS